MSGLGVGTAAGPQEAEDLTVGGAVLVVAGWVTTGWVCTGAWVVGAWVVGA